MFRQKLKSMLFSIALILALSAPAVYAQPGEAESGQKKPVQEKMEARHQEFYKDLDLSDSQKKLLEENKNNHRDQMKAMLDQIKDKKASIRQELQKDTLNMARINQINDELKKLEDRMLDYRLERILEVRKILTPEQFKKFITKMEAGGGRFKAGRKDMGEKKDLRSRKEHREAKVKLLTDAAAALRQSNPDLAKGLEEMAKNKHEKKEAFGEKTEPREEQGETVQ